jgi:hypothetical protein
MRSKKEISKKQMWTRYLSHLIGSAKPEKTKKLEFQ